MRGVFPVLGLLFLGACQSGTDDDNEGPDGADSGGGGANSGGATASGGTTSAGGNPGSGSTTASGGGNASGGATGAPRLPVPNAAFDYQLGGAYEPPTGVAIVSRDRTATPATGLYNICYINGFQIQPNEEDFWMEQHPELVLRDSSDQPVIDADWDEMLLDVGSDEKRSAIAAIVDEWIAGCASAGFDAVEVDNLDSFSRSQGLLSENDAVAMVRLFADSAHAAGLAIAQKNAAELVPRRAEMDTDFVVAEECNTYDECGDFVDGYGEHVLIIEYDAGDFAQGCTDFPGLSIVLRDRDLVDPDSAGYVFDGC